jgi:hypothetical protein
MRLSNVRGRDKEGKYKKGKQRGRGKAGESEKEGS